MEIVFPLKSPLLYYSAINIFSLIVILSLFLSLLLPFLWWHFFLSWKGHGISRCSLPEAWLLKIMRFNWSVSKNLPRVKTSPAKAKLRSVDSWSLPMGLMAAHVPCVTTRLPRKDKRNMIICHRVLLLFEPLFSSILSIFIVIQMQTNFALF